MCLKLNNKCINKYKNIFCKKKYKTNMYNKISNTSDAPEESLLGGSDPGAPGRRRERGRFIYIYIYIYMYIYI